MKLLFKVNRAAAFRRGINTEIDYAGLEVDPAKLNQHQRDLIAAHLRNNGEVFAIRGGAALIQATAPTLEGLIEALQAYEEEPADYEEQPEEPADIPF